MQLPNIHIFLFLWTMLLAMPTYAAPVPPGPGPPRTPSRPPTRHRGEALPNPYQLPGSDMSIDFVNVKSTNPPLSSTDMQQLISRAEQQTLERLRNNGDDPVTAVGTQKFSWKSVMIGITPVPNLVSSKRALTHKDCLRVLEASALKMWQEGYIRRTGRILVDDDEIGRVVIGEAGKL
ncbi:MAG: hypothetical protein Q9182_006631 [Xanthomendoza sp. 2 TL-2023]